MTTGVRHMDRKLLFFDVDGTIVTKDHFVPSSAREALAAALEAGHILMINTGRPFLHIEPQIKALPMSGYICSLGGTILLGGEKLRYTAFSAEESRWLRDLGYACGMDMLFESEHDVTYDLRCANPIGEREYQWLTSIGVPGNRDSFREDFTFDKFVCWPREDGAAEKFRAGVGDRLTLIDREHHMLEAVRRGLSKAGGMDLMMERLGIPREDTVAFGDGANDLPMLRAAGTAVLLGNAPEELWDEADYVSSPIEEDGLYRAMDHFHLL